MSRRPEPPERTVMVRAPSFNATGKAWRPYRFRNLEKITKTQVLLSERLEWLMPPATAAATVAEGVVARLSSLFEEKVRLSLDHVHVIRPKELRRYVATPTFLAVLAPAPHKSRGLLEVELGLANAAIDLLLGGAGEAVSLRPLTDIEEGVMSVVVLSALKALAPNLEPGLPQLRLEGMARSVEEAQNLLSEESQILVLQLKATLGSHSGFVRLFVPGTVLSMTTAPTEGDERRSRRLERAERHLKRLAGVSTWVRVEIGRAEIAAGDLAGLHSGDVVLIDDISARPDRGEGGTGVLRIGLGRAGRVPVEIFLEENRFCARIEGFELGEEPRYEREPGAESEEAAEALSEQTEHAEAGSHQGADEESDDESDDAAERRTGARDERNHTSPGSRGRHLEEAVEEGNGQAEGAELLSDIPLQIAVELARVAASAEDVLGLKVGQVIDLNKVPGEPVELSVQGKVVARGELVEVEGHLGVRVLSLAG